MDLDLSVTFLAISEKQCISQQKVNNEWHKNNGGHWSQVLSCNKYFNDFLNFAICNLQFAQNVFAVPQQYEISTFSYCLNLKVRPFKKASCLIWAKSLFCHISQLTSPPRFEYIPIWFGIFFWD